MFADTFSCIDLGLETVAAALAVTVLVVITSTAYFLAIVFTLLYTFGVNLHTSSITTSGWVAIGFTIGMAATLYLVSGGYLLYYLYKRRRRNHYNHMGKQGFQSITGTGCCKTMQQCHSRLLMDHTSAFIRLVKLDSLVPALCQMGLLSSDDLEGILKKDRSDSRNYQILHMLSILSKKGTQGVRGLIQALKQDSEHTGHEELANILMDAYKDLPDVTTTPSCKEKAVYSHQYSYPAQSWSLGCND